MESWGLTLRARKEEVEGCVGLRIFRMKSFPISDDDLVSSNHVP